MQVALSRPTATPYASRPTGVVTSYPSSPAKNNSRGGTHAPHAPLGDSTVLNMSTQMVSDANHYHDSSRIKPGQYSRQMPVIPARSSSPSKNDGSYNHHSGPSNGKENHNSYIMREGIDSSPSRGRSSHFATTSQPIPIDPKYRLRGNSPEDSGRNGTGSKLKVGSFSPKKGLRSRSRSRSRLFGKDKTDTVNNQAVSTSHAAIRTADEIDADFVDLLDEMQVHPDLRRKLLALSSTVKASMLQGQATLSLAAFNDDGSAANTSTSPSKTARKPIPELLKGRSTRPNSSIFDSSPLLGGASEAFGALNPNQLDRFGDDGEKLAPPNTAQLFGSGPTRNVSGGSFASGSGSSSALGTSPDKSGNRKSSMDIFKSPNLGQGGSLLSLAGSSYSASGTRGRSMSFGRESSASTSKETPESFATMLKCTDASRVDVARVKRMRAVVASESPIWISTFVGPDVGGYDAMLHRLDDLLTMEWREEQHDDQLLHELLRCFVALNTTDVGRVALASHAPTPFTQLMGLLFSEKKPGDLSTRKLIVELLSILLHVQLPASQSLSASSLNYVLSLLQNPVDPAKEAVVDFIKQTHTPRVFKTYVVELASVCRDYFWIFCHSQNLFWRYEELGERIEGIKGPKVPGGMTGGVEFEAMAYLTSHLKLINSLATMLEQSKPHQLPRPAMTASEFHNHLFTSGIERVLATLRRSSQHYYARTHLELARYLALATRAGTRLPYHLSDWLEAPKQVAARPTLPPLELPYTYSPSAATKNVAGASGDLLAVTSPTAAIVGSSSGYGYATQFIAPNAPARQSSVPQNEPKPLTVNDRTSESQQDRAEDWRQDLSNALAEAAKVPLPLSPRVGERGRDAVATIPFEQSFEQFPSPVSASAAKFGMASASQLAGSSVIPGAPVRQPTAPSILQMPHQTPQVQGSVVGSAIKKWESMSISVATSAAPRPAALVNQPRNAPANRHA
ncbi:hypothetical protein BCV70DRAFT_199337 [Testicularia cyperi]|uniref:Formin GTPase-binding domain-containing protein n=1 Tax=Testicularia cyperi TaxID=1882483 RepID=A0A317XS87_9BASI|nr:hypothetical protein BCV70DRAFT_199337 [Testicularia cyperi]